MSMTKKDYEALADTIHHELEQWSDNSGVVWGQEATRAIKGLAKRLAWKMHQDNPKFDSKRFLTACGVEI